MDSKTLKKLARDIERAREKKPTKTSEEKPRKMHWYKVFTAPPSK